MKKEIEVSSDNTLSAELLQKRGVATPLSVRTNKEICQTQV